MPEKTILVWFRNDLRIHDNEILYEAVRKSTSIVPVFCFDPRYFSRSAYGTCKTGAVRAKFLIESVADLKVKLRELGGDLLTFTGKPEDVLPVVARTYHVNEVYHHREVAFGETEISELAEAALWKLQINLRHFIGHTLYHKEDLPFPIKDIPDVFASFRKKTERDSLVRPGFDTPAGIRTPDLEVTELPTLESLGFGEPLGEADFVGGESAGLERLHTWFEKEAPRNAKHGKAVFSSRLSPWIALGCLSVRRVYWEARKYERETGLADAVHALILELLWRDHFRFMFKKHGAKLFAGNAPDGPPFTNAAETERFERWTAGKTGQSAVDGAMRTLNATGFIGNNERKLLAGYLTADLGVNWTAGAAWFEEKLIDYSPASNWGNWAHIAGIGNGTGKKDQALQQA